MIDISGRAVRAGIRSITAVAAASCFAVMPQVTSSASAHTGGKAGRAHDRTTPNRDHDGHGHGGQAARDHARGRADVVVDTKGPRGAIVPGKTYNWPFEVTNRGTVPARDVALTTTPDKNLKVLAAPPKCHWRKAGLLVCHIGLLPQGKTRHGVITATVVPPTHTGKARKEHVQLRNPVQVSWHNAPTPERRLAAFPPVEVSPDGSDTGAAPQTAADELPYPLMVTEHGPGTAESVVVRSPIGAPAADGPCSLGVVPGRTAGEVHADQAGTRLLRRQAGRSDGVRVRHRRAAAAHLGSADGERGHPGPSFPVRCPGLGAVRRGGDTSGRLPEPSGDVVVRRCAGPARERGGHVRADAVRDGRRTAGDDAVRRGQAGRGARASGVASAVRPGRAGRAGPARRRAVHGHRGQGAGQDRRQGTGQDG